MQKFPLCADKTMLAFFGAHLGCQVSSRCHLLFW